MISFSFWCLANYCQLLTDNKFVFKWPKLNWPLSGPNLTTNNKHQAWPSSQYDSIFWPPFLGIAPTMEGRSMMHVTLKFAFPAYQNQMLLVHCIQVEYICQWKDLASFCNRLHLSRKNIKKLKFKLFSLTKRIKKTPLAYRLRRSNLRMPNVYINCCLHINSNCSTKVKRELNI